MERRTCDVLIRDTWMLDEHMVIQKNIDIGIEAGRILFIRQTGDGDVQYSSDEVIEGRGKLWMPGLTDGHMHTGQQLLRGRILDELPMIWTRIMLPFESTLTPEKMKLSGELAALEMIKSGTCAFVDAGSYHMEAAAAVYEQSGLRGALSYSTMDRGKFPDSIRDTAEEAMEKTDRLYDAFHGAGNLQVFYSLRSLLNCSEHVIRMAFSRAAEKDTKIQAHMNEYPNEVNYHLENFRMRPFEYLDSLGVLHDRFIAAHSLLLSEQEIEIMKEYDIKAVHCPFSNCGKGVPNTPALHKAGIVTALGTDGTAHGGLSLFNEMKIFRSVMNAHHGTRLADPAVMPAAKIIEMATAGGAAVMGPAEESGRIKEGFRADLISIDWQQPHLYFSNNPVNSIVESANSGDVSDMLVAGKIIMRRREVLTLDEEKILYETGEYMRSME